MKLQITLIVAILILLAGVGAWFYFAQAQSSSEQALPAQQVMADIQAIERELADLRRLKTVRLDIAILKDPFLQSLQTPLRFIPADPRATTTSLIRNIPPGRPNPFIPF